MSPSGGKVSAESLKRLAARCGITGSDRTGGFQACYTVLFAFDFQRTVVFCLWFCSLLNSRLHEIESNLFRPGVASPTY